MNGDITGLSRGSERERVEDDPSLVPPVALHTWQLIFMSCPLLLGTQVSAEE